MKQVLFCAAMAVLVGCGGNAAETAPAASPSAPAAQSQAPQAAAPSELKAIGEAKVGDKTKCPVSGEEFVVTTSSPKVEHAGKTYYFCCAGCDKKFQANPEKFLAKH